MDLEFIEQYINNKLSENEDYVRITFYDLRVKNNLTQEETEMFIHLVKTKLQNMKYNVYTTDEKFEYKNANMTVQPNELLVAIKSKEEVN